MPDIRTETDFRSERSTDVNARETALREILRVISNSRHDENPVFEVILKNASILCDAPMVAVVLISKDRRHYGIAAHHGARPDFVKWLAENPPELDPERYAAARAMVDMQTQHVKDLANPDLYGAQDRARIQSTVLEGIRTTLYVPLVSQGQSIGCIALWRRVVAPFSDDQIALIDAFAEQAVIAIENVRQFKALQAKTEEIQELNAGLESRVTRQVAEIERVGRLKRFLSPAVANAVVLSGEEQILRSHRAFVATLFADLRGFTAFCESAAAEETIDLLNAYYETIGELLIAHDAGIDQRVGDGVMAVFNHPLPCEDPTGSAVSMAMAMRGRIAELCSGWKQRGHNLGFGVGISLGYATVGMVGSESRSEYTAYGSVVNLAARLCEHAEDTEILLSQQAASEVAEHYDVRRRGSLNLKGFESPVEVFAIAADAPP